MNDYKKKYGPKPIGVLFEDLSAAKGWDEKYNISRLPEVWKEITGETISKCTKVNKYESGKLYIITTSSTWRTELQLRKQILKDKINEILGKDFVIDIIIR